MFRPGFPRLSHPGLAHATPSTGFMAQVYRGAWKLIDQQRAEQAPAPVRVGNSRWSGGELSGHADGTAQEVTGFHSPVAWHRCCWPSTDRLCHIPCQLPWQR